MSVDDHGDDCGWLDESFAILCSCKVVIIEWYDGTPKATLSTVMRSRYGRFSLVIW